MAVTTDRRYRICGWRKRVFKVGRVSPRAKHESCRGRRSVAVARAVIVLRLFKLKRDALFAGLRIPIIILREGAVDSYTTGDARKAGSGNVMNRVNLVLMRRSSGI
jgi:hypothetical protein